MIPGINLHYCRHFIRHYRSATRIDVLHSPFVFDLYQSCISRQPVTPSIEAIESLRKNLKQDKTPVQQMDLGSASPSIKKRTVKGLAYIHAKPARIAAILYHITKKYRHKDLIELGTSLGISTAYQAMALKENFSASETRFTTIEGAPELAALAQKNFERLGLTKYITQVSGNFDERLPQLLNEYKTIDLVFIDGNHRYEPTMAYFRRLLPHMHNDSILVFDDIYWSAGMKKAWEEIKQHPDVKVTVDLFYIGLVFFRKEQVKEHFRLRIW